jgi:hypothetical protein
MKNKLIALLATIGLVSSASAIEINENLSINGFIDGSYQNSETDGTLLGVPADAETSSLGLDEVELNFILNAGNVSGEVHIDTNGEGSLIDNDHLINIEQAFISYSLDNGVKVTFGRKGLNSGFEREDPAGLYTFSRAYDYGVLTLAAPGLFRELGNVDAYTVEGIDISYSSDAFRAGVYFFQDSAADLETDDLNTELFFEYTGIENLNAYIGYLIQDNIVGNSDAENDVLNIHASYQIDKLLIAAEYTEIDAEDAGVSIEGDAIMLLANYTITDSLGATLRYSEMEDLADKITAAASYQISENLGAIIEYSKYEDDGLPAVADLDSDLIAVELTYTF